MIDQSRRHGKKLESRIDKLQPFLRDRDLGTRAAISKILGNIGTSEAIGLIVAALMFTSEKELNTKCRFSCWSAEPLHYWFASGIGETKNRETALVLISLLDSEHLSASTKSSIMTELSFYDLEFYEVPLPKNVVDILEELAMSKDKNIAGGAIRLLGLV